MSEVEFKKLAICDTCGTETLCREHGVDDQCAACYWAPINHAKHQSELAALREELATSHRKFANCKLALDAQKHNLTVLKQRLTAAEQRNAELKQQLDSIDKHLRGNVNDPYPLPPIMPGAFSYTTTYGLVAGLRRERDYLKKSTDPLPAGDDYLRQLAQRLREYVGNPHHINPLSEAFKRLIDDSAFALSKLAALKPVESGPTHVDAERYRKLRTVTPYRFKRMQDASVTDGGDVLYFHSGRFDVLMDAELAKPT